MWKKFGFAFLVLMVIAAAFVIRPDRSIESVEAEYKTSLSKFATLKDGTRIHYWETGNRSAPTLILVHGSYDSADTWEGWVPELASDFHIIAPDLPAHGLTGQTVANNYTLDGMVAAVHELVEQLGLERFHMGGNSLGGVVSWRYALAHPEQVERLVLVNSGGYPGLHSLTETDPNAVVRLFYRYGNPQLLLRSGFENAVVDPATITDERIDRSVAYLRRENSREAHMQREGEQEINKQPYAQIPNIEEPTLILWGEKDALIPVEHAKRFDADLPNSELIIYENIGHMPQIEIPERSAGDARRFLLAPAPPPPAAPAPVPDDAGAAEQPPSAE